MLKNKNKDNQVKYIGFSSEPILIKPTATTGEDSFMFPQVISPIPFDTFGTSTTIMLPKNNKILTFVGILLIITGLFVGVLQNISNRNIIAVTSSNKYSAGSDIVNKQDSDNAVMPSEDKNGANSIDYGVAFDQPKYLRISKIGVDAKAMPVFKDGKGNMGAPNNIHTAGWYNESIKPGTKGAVVIDGHVHGPKDPGVFANLKKLAQGDFIEIERGDGLIFRYQVVLSRAYDVDSVDMAALLNPIHPGKEGLNLVTCTGAISGSEYNQRLIVFAEKV